MFHNREFQRFSLCFLIFALLECIISLCVSFETMCLVTIALLFAYGLCTLYTYRRYQNIRQLSQYLETVYQGVETMDIREYCEGELSVLKSDLYKVTSILKQQAESLRKDTTFLADSLSDISHQLKTPLTSMMVMSDLLQEELPETKRKEFISQIQIQLKRIDWLISTLLKLSKIDAKAIVFHFQQYSLSSLLDLALAPLRIPMEVREQTLQVQCDETLYLYADEHWVVEAFTNILKNCMEHTPTKGVLSITCSDSPLHTTITIRDTGHGIDAQDIPHIFERFYKGKQASSDSAGIGLALAKSILMQHQARIQVESQVGIGTCFTICFYK